MMRTVLAIQCQNKYRELFSLVFFASLFFSYSLQSIAESENIISDAFTINSFTSDDLLRATRENHTQEILTALKEKNHKQTIDVNIRSSDGTTALHWAVYHNNEALVKNLIKHGAKANIINDYGATPLSEAAEVGNEKVIKHLLKAGANIESANHQGQTALMTLARSNNIKAAKLVIKSGADVNAREQWQEQSALMWASAQGQGDMTRLLIKYGADVNARSKIIKWERRVSAEPRPQNRPLGGLTPLLFAAREGCLECTRALIKGSADINLPDPNGISPLLMATLNARFDVAKELINGGADVNQWDIWGRSPLYSAIDYNTLPQGGRPDRLSLDKTTALQVAERLLESGANANVQLKLFPPYRSLGGDRGGDSILGIGTTPLIRAAKAGDIDSITLLLKFNALADLKNWAGYTPLLAASGLGSTSVDARARFMNQEKNLRVANLLLQNGASINAINSQGNTALHGAASRGWNDFVKSLLENNANANIENNRQFTALDAAKGLIPSRRGFISEAHPDTAEIIENFVQGNTRNN